MADCCYGVRSYRAIELRLCDTWWYRVENLDGSPFPVEVELIGVCDNPEARSFVWPDKQVFKLVRKGYTHAT